MQKIFRLPSDLTAFSITLLSLRVKIDILPTTIPNLKGLIKEMEEILKDSNDPNRNQRYTELAEAITKTDFEDLFKAMEKISSSLQRLKERF